MVMDHIEDLRNGSPQQQLSEFSRLIELLKETLAICREIYSIRQIDLSIEDSMIVFKPVVLLPLYTVLGSDNEMCFFILFLSNQLDSNLVWEQYGIEKSGRMRGLDTTYNIRLVDFVEFEEIQYLRDKFLSFIDTQKRRAAPTNTIPPTSIAFAQKL